MKIKHVLPMLAIVLTSLSIASCDGTVNSNPQPSNPENSSGLGSVTPSESVNVNNNTFVPELKFDPNKEVEITFYHSMNKNLQEVVDLYIGDFEELYPNITVQHRAIGSYDDILDQLTKSIAAGDVECDVAYCYPDHLADYNKAKAVVPLDAFVNSTAPLYEGSEEIIGFTQEQKDDFIEAYWQEGYSLGDGNFYCLPFSKSSEAMYYNKTFFDKHNLQVPETWEELWEVCEEIKKIDPNSIPLGYDSSSNMFITLVEQSNSGYTTLEGNERYIFNNEINKSLVSSFAEQYDKGLFTTKALYGAYTSGLFVEADPSATRSYIAIGSTAGATNQLPPIDDNTNERLFEVGMARIPQIDPDNGKVISQGPDIFMLNTKDNQRIMASWLLMKYLTTCVDLQAQFSMMSGYTPVIKSVRENAVYADFLANANGAENLAALSTKLCLEQEDWYFTSPAFAGSAKARDEVGFIVDAVFSKTKSIDQAFLDAYNNCNEI